MVHSGRAAAAVVHIPSVHRPSTISTGPQYRVTRSTGSLYMLVPNKISVAAYHGELRQVVEWLNYGHPDSLGENGDGMLHAAAAGGRLTVAKELLLRDASVDLRGSDNTTPLMCAAACGQHAMVRLLLEHEAIVDLQNDSCDTALVAANAAGCLTCVQELLDACVDLPDNDGLTALQLAEIARHSEMAKVVRKREQQTKEDLDRENSFLLALRERQERQQQQRETQDAELQARQAWEHQERQRQQKRQQQQLKAMVVPWESLTPWGRTIAARSPRRVSHCASSTPSSSLGQVGSQPLNAGRQPRLVVHRDAASNAWCCSLEMPLEQMSHPAPLHPAPLQPQPFVFEACSPMQRDAALL